MNIKSNKRGQMNIISIEKTKIQGAWRILGEIGRSITYFFYTKKQAIKQHKKYMRELKRK